MYDKQQSVRVLQKSGNTENNAKIRQIANAGFYENLRG